MAIASEVRAAVEEFRSRIPSMREPSWHVHRNADMKIPRAARKTSWAASGGIYAFYSGAGELRYIGRALLGVGLASRVPDHLKSSRYGNPEWNKVLVDVDAHVEVCALDDADGVWVPSLELFLCERFRGLVNRRRS
jgi:hypothetical protein